jgi:hypothetical protein
MNFFYNIIENGELYEYAYKTYEEAVQAVKEKYEELLNEEDILCDIDVPESITNQTNLYIEKGINIIIQKTLINNT